VRRRAESGYCAPAQVLFGVARLLSEGEDHSVRCSVGDSVTVEARSCAGAGMHT